MTKDAPDLVEVTRARDLFEARILAGLLESHGIPAHIPGSSTLDTLDGAAAIWSEGIPIVVPRDRATAAREVLLDRSPGDDEEEIPDALG
jgi:hypothetical protein